MLSSLPVADRTRRTTRVLPQYDELFDGAAIRGPVPVGSIADIVFVLERNVTVDEVNDVFEKEAQSERYRGILGVAEDPVVSSDIIKDSRASVIDPGMTTLKQYQWVGEF